MRKRIAVLLMAGTLGAGALTPVAFAQEEPDPTTEEDEGSDYGWVGLLGLAGLAGLLGLRRHHDHDRNRGSSTR